jgi:hypothetical protein
MTQRYPVQYKCIQGDINVSRAILAIYAPMIYMAQCIMFLTRADPLRKQVGGGWALEIESFFGPVKWHRADSEVPLGAQNSRFPGPNPLPLAQVMDLHASKIII